MIKHVVLLLVVASWIGSALAETIPATPTVTHSSLPKTYQKNSSAICNDSPSCWAAIKSQQNNPNPATTGTIDFSGAPNNPVCANITTSGQLCWVRVLTATPGQGTYSYNDTLTARGLACPSGTTQSGTTCVSYSCPAGQNWTVSGASCTRPDCASNEVRDPATGLCNANACSDKTVGQEASPWGYRQHENPTIKPAYLVCVDGCKAVFQGEIGSSKKSLVNGERKYWSWGRYVFEGPGFANQCTAGGSSPAPSGSSASVPADTCPATHFPTKINGETRCVDRNTGLIPVAKSEETKTQNTSTVQPDGSTVKTSTTTYPDGSSTVEQSTYEAGSDTPSAVTTWYEGDGSSEAARNSPSGTSSGATQFPADYAKSGEARAAADEINAFLGAKLDGMKEGVDKLSGTGDNPADPTIPGAAEFDNAFFSGTFSALQGWQLPAHASACPVGSFTWRSASYSINAHCQLFADHSAILTAAMTVVWSIAALFVVLRA